MHAGKLMDIGTADDGILAARRFSRFITRRLGLLAERILDSVLALIDDDPDLRVIETVVDLF